MPSLIDEDDVFGDLLPNTVSPINYDINLRPDNDIFYGSVGIRIEIFETISGISFHLQKLIIDYGSVRLVQEGSNPHIQYKLRGQRTCLKTHITTLFFDTE